MRRRRKNRKRKEIKCTRYVLLKDVPSMSRKEEYVGVMEQRTVLRNILAAMKDVPTMLSREEYVEGTVPRPNSAVMKDVLTLLSKEEYVKGMVLRSSSVATRDAPTKPRKEVYVLDTRYKEVEITCKTNGCTKRNVAMREYHLHRKE